MWFKLIILAYTLLLIFFITNCCVLHWGELDTEFYNFLFKANVMLGIAVGYFTYAFICSFLPKDDHEADLS